MITTTSFCLIASPDKNYQLMECSKAQVGFKIGVCIQYPMMSKEFVEKWLREGWCNSSFKSFRGPNLKVWKGIYYTP